MATGLRPGQAAPTLPLQQVERIVARFRYKPGWRFGVESNGHLPYDGPILRIEADHHDARNPGRTILYIQRTTMGPLYSEEQVKMIVEVAIDEAEEHERGEWLLYDGQRIRDPHR
jgi:hypothetical protein